MIRMPKVEFVDNYILESDLLECYIIDSDIAEMAHVRIPDR